MRTFTAFWMVLLTSVLVFGAETAPGPGPDEALALLKSGQDRFLSGNLLHPHQDAARRIATAGGQSPYAAILGCSDSRESLDVIFDAGLGDLFTIRVAGNVADTDEIASIEYGAEHLHVPLILVLGHTSCGAVTAVVSHAALGGQLPGLLDNILAPAARSVATYGAGAKDLVDRTARENVLQSVQDLLTRSKILAELVEAGKVKVVGGLYHLDTGGVDWIDPVPGADGWVKAGLEGGVQPSPVRATLGGPFSLGAPGWVDLAWLVGGWAFLALVQAFLVGDRRILRGLKLLGRLTVSFLAVVLFSVAGAVWAVATGDLWTLLAVLVPASVFAVVFSRTHYRGFEAFFSSQKRLWTAQGPGRS